MPTELQSGTNRRRRASFGGKIPTVVVGPSGIGKGTLLKRLKEQYPGSFSVAVSHTTRKPRSGEVDGVTYNFVDCEMFHNMIANNEFIEHAQFGSNFYGTSLEAVENVSKSGKICLLEIDLQGAKSVRELGLEAKFIFITTSGDTLSILKERLFERGSETVEQIEERLETAKCELKFINENAEFFDLILKNDDLEDACRQLVSKMGSWYQLQPAEDGQSSVQ